MKRKPNGVITFLTRQDIADIQFGKIILEFIIANLPKFKPNKIGNFEPLKKHFVDVDSSLELWQTPSPFLWTGEKKSGVEGSVWFGSENTLSKISIYFPFPLYDEIFIIEALTMFVKLFHIDIAYYHVISEEEINNISHYQLKLLNLGFVVQELKKGLPILPWFTIFGEAYVNLITEIKLLSTPAFAINKLNNNSISVQLTNNANDLIYNYSDIFSARIKATNHLSGFFWGDSSVQIPMEYNEMGMFGGSDRLKKITELQNKKL